MSDEQDLLDGTRTSFEWRERRPTACVLPVGAFEQHSRHMALACDAMEAEYFGAFLAGEIGAALLPTLNYGTSLEQSGFMGTVSLRPETLMAVVRDIADEVESQGFRVLIIFNGHGGNFALGPVVRDINRRDRPLKLMLVPFWSDFDNSFLEAPKLGKPDIHAGEFETSLVMALRPEWVDLEKAKDMEPAVAEFLQPDLNTFGVGYVAPEGAYGVPSLATPEKGERIVAGIKESLVRHVRQRLAWLETNPTYSGKDRTNNE